MTGNTRRRQFPASERDGSRPPGWVRSFRVVVAAATVVLALAVTGGGAAAQQPDGPWLNAALSADERAALLLRAMTLEEKVELMTGDQGAAAAAFYNAPIERLGIPELSMADAGAGIAPRGWMLPGTGDRATALPAGIALGATWDRDVARSYAGVVGDEARATGHEVLLGPGADPIRQPYWGRAAENPSENPFLIGEITTPFVQEVQERSVIANLKHYAGYQQEVNRGRGQNSVISERALHEVWTFPYKDAVEEADLGSVMCAFNKVNGVYACENEQLLDEILREELGFTGFVLTDFGALHSTEPSIGAGTDMETGTRAFYDGPLLAAVREGRVPEALVDRSVLRILRTMFAIGVFDDEYPLTSIPVEEHGALAREVQEDAITLLRNRGVLPLDEDTDSIALIGADANVVSTIGGSAFVRPTYTVPLLEALRERADDSGSDVRWVPGNDPVHGANMIETADLTAVPSAVLTPESGSGRGLTARYWGNMAFSGDPGVTRTERQVSFDVGFVGGQSRFARFYASQVPPTPALGADPLGGGQSAVYTGYLTAPRTGSYRLGLTGWGDARLYLDGELIVESTGVANRWAEDVSVDLVAGERHSIRVEYVTRALVPLQPGTLLLQWAPPSNAYDPEIRRARRAARDADVAIVYLRTYETEERDRVSLKLPQNADRLVRAVGAVNPNTVVVVASGGPVTMPWRNRVAAMVQNWYGGQEEGNALTSILFGDESPSGHLPITFPRNERATGPGQENPWATYDDLDVEFYEDVNIGYRGYIAEDIEPAFPFGHGLSYTEFQYDRLRTRPLRTRRDTARVRLRLTNTGDREGTEVVQVYAGPLPGVESPKRKLVGFAKVELEAGERANVRIDIEREQLSYWDEDRDRWVAPTGRVPVYVGSSATEVRLTGTITVR
jgi:beta-glucosidase